MRQSGVVLRLGRLMLGSGSGSYRVKSSMARAAAAVGLDRHEAQVTLTEIATSSYAGGNFRTEVTEQRTVGVNADRLDALHDVVRDLDAHTTVESLEAQLDRIEATGPRYGAVVNALASGFACAAFCFLNGGGFIECGAVLVAALIGQWVRRILLGKRFNHFLVWLLCGALASGIYIGVVSALEASGVADATHQGGIISAILFLIPGFPMVTAMLDLVRLDVSAALSRAAYVLLVMAAAGVAVWTVTYLSGWEVDATYLAQPPALWLWTLRFVCSFIAAAGFAVLFNTAPGTAVAAGAIGAIANTGRLALVNLAGVPWHLSVGLAALAVGLMCALASRVLEHSRVTLSVPAVVIMIPGVPFYRAISALNDATVDPSAAVGSAAASLVEVFLVVTAIGAGLALARVLTDRNWRHDVTTSHLPRLEDDDPRRSVR